MCRIVTRPGKARAWPCKGRKPPPPDDDATATTAVPGLYFARPTLYSQPTYRANRAQNAYRVDISGYMIYREGPALRMSVFCIQVAFRVLVYQFACIARKTPFDRIPRPRSYRYPELAAECIRCSLPASASICLTRHRYFPGHPHQTNTSQEWASLWPVGPPN
jgi:hypothetical protein